MSTIAAISTAKGIGGIGVIRISGDDAIKIASKVFVPFNNSTKVMDMKGNPLLLFVNAWSVGMTLDRNDGLVLSEFGKN